MISIIKKTAHICAAIVAMVIAISTAAYAAELKPDRWDHVEHAGNCRGVATSELEFLNCAVVKGDETLERMRLVAQRNLAKAKRNMLGDTSPIISLLEMPEEKLSDMVEPRAFKIGHKGFVWMWMNYPKQLIHQDLLNEQRLAKALAVQEATSDEALHDEAAQIEAASREMRERLVNSRDLIMELQEEMFGGPPDIHPDHRLDIPLYAEQ